MQKKNGKKILTIKIDIPFFQKSWDIKIFTLSRNLLRVLQTLTFGFSELDENFNDGNFFSGTL